MGEALRRKISRKIGAGSSSLSLRKPPLIAIVGPNASGKSDLAVRLAKEFGGEIISADSRQVYRGLDIATGKVAGRWHRTNVQSKTLSLDSVNILRPRRMYGYRGIPHHCIDFVSPRRAYSVSEYQRCAAKAIAGAHHRGNLPFLVGGTGFWADAVGRGLEIPPVPPNPNLRRELARKSPVALLKILARLDPERAQTIEAQNPRRIIRAIEIASVLGRVPKLRARPAYRVLWIGIRLPERELARRIRRRLALRVGRGMIEEARRLRQSGLPWQRFYELGLEYRYLADYLRGRIGRDELTPTIERAIRRFARRQMRWFGRNKNIRWVRRSAEAERLVRGFLGAGSPSAGRTRRAAGASR